MVRPRIATPILLFALIAASTAVAKPEQCEKKGNRAQVFVKPNTPLYRGPGLNYPVAGFLERARCVPFSEVSVDRQWVLVDLGDKLGWVERGTLASSSQELIANAGVGDGPIGSGQKRGYVEAVSQVLLMERPAQSGEPKSTMPEGSKMLGLAITKNGRWVQVRDERGQIGWVPTRQLKGPGLDGLPITDDAFKVGVSTNGGGDMDPDADPDPPDVVEAPGPTFEQSAGVNMVAAVFGAALAPVHSLSTNSPNGYRSYDLSSFSGGAALEVGINDLGPISLRVGYQFAAVAGLSPEANPNRVLSGFQHDAQLRVGLPLAAGPALFTPELGYAFGLFDFDVNLPGTPAQFLSTLSNTGLAGIRMQVFAARSVLLELEASFLFGATSEGPAQLGDAGFTLGTIVSGGAQFLITDLISVVARYHLNYRRTPYKGPATFDSTIGEATLTDLSHGLMLGVAFTVGG